MLVRMVLHSKKDGYKAVIKRMDAKRYERLQNKLGMVEGGVELVELQILEK